MLTCILFADDEWPPNDWKTNITNKESEFNYQGDTYKLIVNGKDKYDDFSSSHYLNIKYEVYKNGKLLNNKIKADNIINSNCNYTNGGNYWIETIEWQNSSMKNPVKLGWMITTGDYCSASSSYYNITMIFPTGDKYDRYIALNKIFTDEPEFISTEKGLNIYFPKAEYNFGGTASSTLIFHKFFYDKNENIIIEKDIDKSDLRYLPHKDFRGLFMLGINNLDSDIMQYALDNYYDSDSKDSIVWFFGCYEITNPFIEDIVSERGSNRFKDCSKESFQEVIDLLDFQN